MNTKVLDRQTLDFGARFLQNLPQIGGDVMQDWIECPPALQEHLEIFAVSPFVVTPDRSDKPQYPNFMKEVLHPELECEGPTEFHLRKGLILWLHEGQQNSRRHTTTTGTVIYEHIKESGMFAGCLNLQDGYAIQAKGISVFRKLFEGKSLLLWKSVVSDGGGNLFVPYLCDDGNQVEVHWVCLDRMFTDEAPSLLYVGPHTTTP